MSKLIKEIDFIDLLTCNHLKLSINAVIYLTFFCFVYFCLALLIQYFKIINKI